MPPRRSPEGILDDIVKKEARRGAKLRAKLSVNRDRNWLLALTLNAFAKFDANAPLTDLEKALVENCRKHGVSDAKLKTQGRLYRRLPEAVRDDIFPGKFSDLTEHSQYTFNDLKADAKPIATQVFRMPNARKIDVEGIHRGEKRLRDELNVNMPILKRHGSWLVSAQAPNTRPPNPKFTIKAVSFRCLDESNEWSASDEPYWIFGSVGTATSTPVTTVSRVFSGVDANEARTFDDDEGCIWGQNCLAQDLPNEVGSLVSLWEHDYGDPQEIKDGVAIAFAAAATVLVASGVAAWVGAIVAGVGALIQWLLSFLDDDHIADQTFLFSRQVIKDQLFGAGQSFDLTRILSDQDAEYRLRIRVTRF